MRQAVERIRSEHHDEQARTLPALMPPRPPVGCCRCNQPSWVMVRCADANYAAFLCANDLAPVVQYFVDRGLRYTIDPLVSAEESHVIIGGIHIPLYVRATFNGVIGDADPFDDAEVARLAVETQLYDRLGRHLERGEQILVAAAVSIEWQRRDRRAREEAAHQASDWLLDFQAGLR
jgi:hypothetical protein